MSEMRKEMLKMQKDQERSMKEMQSAINRLLGAAGEINLDQRARSMSVIHTRSDPTNHPSVLTAQKAYAVNPVIVQKRSSFLSPSVGTFNPPRRPQLLAPINLMDVMSSKPSQAAIRKISAARNHSSSDVYKGTTDPGTQALTPDMQILRD